MAVIDISDPTNPGTPVYETTTGIAQGIYVSGDYAYVATGHVGLAIIDISNPINPGTPVYEDTTGHAIGIFISGNYAYVADDESGLAVIDISDSTNPETPIYEDTIGFGHKVHVSGNYAYMATDESGLAIIQVRKRIDMEDPIILNASSDLTVEYGYTAQNLSWTATDANPDTYTIELTGTGIVATSTPWANNTPIEYNIPDGFSVGSYYYTVNFTDDFGYFITDSVNFTVQDTINPVITFNSNNFTMEVGYAGKSLSWTATDANPDLYTIELQGTGIVAGPTAWTSGNAINYNIPDGFAPGVYTYNITFTDESGNSISNTVMVTINSNDDDEPPGGAIPFGNSFLIYLGFSVICLIFAKKRQIVREFR